MKASVSGLPRSIYILAAVYLAAHVPFLAPSLEDYDSINFALGLRDFDPARHQPHPPGSPVYIALGRVAYAIVNAVAPASTRADTEALALAWISALGGAAAIIAFAAICWCVVPPARRRVVFWAAAVFGASPLMWISGLRPMSDAVGLAAALSAQALILHGRTKNASLLTGALVAALAAGIRVQTVWLTMPLLVFVLARHRFTWHPLAALAVGGLAWAVPLVADSGGLDAYLAALGGQAGEDFAWVNMLWLEPTPRRLAFVLYETFVLPWGSAVLAGVVMAAAAIGFAYGTLRERGTLGVLLLAFAPYILFHMLFQETITVRYALPVLPLIAWLAIEASRVFGQRASPIAVPVMAASLFVALPAAVAYGGSPHPAFQAIADARPFIGKAPPAAVFSHHSLARSLQADPLPIKGIEPRWQYEWLGPTEYWRSGGPGPIWFFADPRRTDLALVDPRAREDVVRYRWAVERRPEFSGIRPAGADWYRIPTPGWFATEGWSLTPETGGLASATGRGPDRRPIEAWVRRRPQPVHLVTGGRHLGSAGDPPLEFELAIDGVIHDRWNVAVADPNFLRFLDVPSGLSGDGYARLTIAARAPSSPSNPPAAVRQFDLQSRGTLIFGFAEGWHEEEYDPATGLRWRWTSGRSVLRVKDHTGDVVVALRGESPLKYFDQPPDVQVTVGNRVVGRLQPSDDFEWTLRIPADAVTSSGGAIAIETRPVYRPGEAEGTTDRRELGLRLFECRVYPLPD